MVTRFFTPHILVLLQTLTLTLLTLTSSSYSLNISHYIYPRSSVLDPPPPHPFPLLKDILETIIEREKWKNLDGVRISKLESKKLRHGTSRRYDFKVGFRETEFTLKVFDQMSVWKKVENFENVSNFEDLVKEIAPKAKLDGFKIEGPVELRVYGDDHLLLNLPMNKSHTGLQRILVSEGITLEVIDAEEVNIFHKELNQTNQGMNDYLPFRPPSCEALLPIRIQGSSTIIAYHTLNPNSRIKTKFISKNTIKLLSRKCYITRKKQNSPIESLGTTITIVKKVLSNLINDKNDTNTLGLLKANIKASSMFRFQLVLERDVMKNDTTLAEWRTKPVIERLFFEIVARFDGEILKPLVIKKVRPIIEVDSLSWSNLMSNISFTKFPSVLVAPESLTLDVKW